MSKIIIKLETAETRRQGTLHKTEYSAIFAREDSVVLNGTVASSKFWMAGANYYNHKIKTGSEVTTGAGLVSSLKTLLENQAKFAEEERANIAVCRQRLAQLNETAGHEKFKYADERNAVQNELNAILYELNAKDMLHENRIIKNMPSLHDYIDLGIEVISGNVDMVTEEGPEPETEDLQQSA